MILYSVSSGNVERIEAEESFARICLHVLQKEAFDTAHAAVKNAGPGNIVWEFDVEVNVTTQDKVVT